MSMLVNGHPAANLRLPQTLTIHEVRLPPFAIGENRIEFRYSEAGRVAWDWLEILEPRAMPNGRTPRVDGDTVAIPYRTAAHYQLDLEPGSALVADAVTVDGEVPADDRGRIQLTLRSRSGRSRTTSRIGDAIHIPLRIDRPARFDLEVAVLEPRASSPSATGIRLRNLRVVRQCK